MTAVFMFYILGEAVDYMLVIAEPMADRVPLDRIGGVALANLILFCFVAGLVARNAIASGLVKKTRGESVEEDSRIHVNQGYHGRPA